MSDQEQDPRQKHLAIVRQLKEIQGDSDWTLTQELMQEVCASFTIINPDKMPPVKTLVESLQALIKERYEDDEQFRDLLLESVPSIQFFRQKNSWFKKKNWDEAVWSKVRGTGLFTKEKRAQMIDALFQRGMTKSDIAAKIWLTLSGDYSEKMDISSDKNLDVYREIQSVILNKIRKNE